MLRVSFELKVPLASSELLTPGTIVADRFTILEHLASGGMAEVYVASQSPFGRKVALKVLELEDNAQDDGKIKRFMREAVALSKLTHPNTITVFDFGEMDDRHLYLAMELLDGEPLLDKITRDGALPPEEAVEIAVQVARSLDEAHQLGIVHRDLKPANVFLGRIQRNLVKVLDFGIASYQNMEAGTTRLTQMGTVPGTPEYMSPEQGKGEELDARSDIYSLGIVLYEMLAGDVPFLATTPLATMIKHVNELPPPLPTSVPGALSIFVMRCLEKDAALRPQTAMDFVKELSQAALLGGAYPGPPPSNIASVVDMDARYGGEDEGAITDESLAAPVHNDTQYRTRSEHLSQPTGPGHRAAPEVPQTRTPYSAPVQEQTSTSVEVPSFVLDEDVEIGNSPYEMFMNFAQPVRDAIDARPSPQDLHQALMFARSAWNAVVHGADALRDARDYLERQGSPRMTHVFEELVVRKAGPWREANWIIEDLDVIPQPGGYQIQMTRRMWSE